MIASILWDVDPVWFKVGSWEVRWYGLMWGLGFILAYGVRRRPDDGDPGRGGRDRH